MSDYTNSKIYKIVADDTNKIYIGSSIQKLCKRLAGHKKHKNTLARELFEYPNTRIELIENYSCNSKRELDEREQYYINLNKDICINKYRAFRTKEQFNEQVKQSHEKNKDKIKIKQKEYYNENCKDNNEYKEKIQKYKKEYYNINSDRLIKERANHIINCECGSNIQKHHYSTHLKSKKHLSFL